MSDYKKAVQAMNWLSENTFSHFFIDDNTTKKGKEVTSGRFFVRIECSKNVSGNQLVKMAEELGWKGE